MAGNMLSGELTAQEHLGTLLADWGGLGGAEAFKIEAADASGAAAVRQGYLAVASGVHDFIIACGYKKTDGATLLSVLLKSLRIVESVPLNNIKRHAEVACFPGT